ncbi:putative Metallopeptidase family M24 [Trypanosoma vivax]|nr:proliferation-associated 2g4 [Trypanosoma vivax]KAH8611931.1 putative Metallopeptidase family M24 [Trypanosoma vivax]
MGRGYGGSRSSSARPTLRMKRMRSLSLHEQLRSNSKVTTHARKGSGEAQKCSPSPASEAGSGRRSLNKKRQGSSSVVRTASTIRQRITEMEKELAEQSGTRELPEETILRSDVLNKYKSAGSALDEVMDIVSAAAVPGANTKQLCDLGDEELLQRVRSMFSKRKDADGKRLPRGLSYPTNVSVNHVLCNHAPLKDEDATVLFGGDVVKIHMGCHVDGYPVSAARTIIVPYDCDASERNADADGNSTIPVAANQDRSATGRGTSVRPITQGTSNAIEAARVALHGMIHLLKPGMLNADITDFIHRVGNYFSVQALEGVLSNRTKRWVPDGMECIITRRVTAEAPQQDVAECVIGPNQVWTLDVAFTDHNVYKVSPEEVTETTIFRRTEVDFQNDTRVRSVNASLQEITNKHHCFPFSLKHLENPLRGRMAAAVLRKQGVIDPIPVMCIKGNRHVTTRFSATVAVSERRVSVLCGLPPTEPLAVPEEVLPAPVADDIAIVLAEPLNFGAVSRPKKKTRVETSQ